MGGHGGNTITRTLERMSGKFSLYFFGEHLMRDANLLKTEEEAFLRVTREFDELELIATGMLGVAVPFDAPSDFKARVLAAAGTYFLGKNRSIMN